MSSREIILNAIKETKQNLKPLPDISIAHMQYDDLNAKYATSLASVGGNAVIMDSLADVEAYIKEHYADAKVIVSNVDGLHVSTKDANATDDPHTLQDVDLAIIKGEFAVAENGDFINVPPRTEATTTKENPFMKIKYFDYTGYSKGFQKL